MLDTQIVAMQGDHPTTNTLIIAEHFGKKHSHVMRDLRELISDCPEEFNQSNFGLVEYYDAKGEKRPMYTLTRDGFMLLSMGFTGANATRLKIAFIDAFNKMESEIKRHHEAVPESVARELLTARPLWARIQRYFALGLNGHEIALLLKCNITTVRRHRRRMEACGLLTPPANLAKLQQSGLRLINGGAK